MEKIEKYVADEKSGKLNEARLVEASIDNDYVLVRKLLNSGTNPSASYKPDPGFVNPRIALNEAISFVNFQDCKVIN